MERETTRSVRGLVTRSWAVLLLTLLTACPDSGGGGGESAGLTINQTSASYGVVQNVYSGTTLTATGGMPPYTWALAPGSPLPPGLTLNGATGQVTGTPTSTGSFNVTCQVTDMSGKSGSGVVLFRIQPRTDQVSVSGSGASGDGASTEPAINSTSGQFIVFTSEAANLASTPTTGTQIFIHDRQTGQPSLVSKDNNVTANAGNGGSSAPSISADGSLVAFVSTATNLLAPGGPVLTAGQQIFLRNLQTGQTSLVSRDNNIVLSPGLGFSSAPAISGNGQFVAFVSDATNLLVPGGPVLTAGQQIFLRNLQTGQTSLVSQDNSGTPTPGNAPSSAPAISSDGRFVAFVSTSTNLVTGVIGPPQVYVRDTQLNQTFLASQSTTNLTGDGPSSSPSIASNGNFWAVVFVSSSTNFVTGPPLGDQIYVRNTQTFQTTLVSQDNNTPPNPAIGQNFSPVISSDGLSVAFMSQATNLLAPAPSPTGQQIYLRSLQVGGQTSLVSQDNSGNPAAAVLTATPAITINGSFVAFVSTATNLVTSPPSAAPEDIFVRALP